jgi:hypothetical protein
MRAREKTSKLGPRARRAALSTLRTALAARGFAREGTWVPSSANLTISEALLALVRPYLEEDTDIIGARVLALLAGVAWNLDVVPDVGRDERRDLVLSLVPDDVWQLDRVLEDMRLRKIELFPDDRRIIALTKVHLQSDGNFFFTAAAAAD